MAGDPIEDGTVTYTGGTQNLTSTDSNSYDSRVYSTSFTFAGNDELISIHGLPEPLLKKFEKIKQKLEIKEGWFYKKTEIPILILRPSVQLRGVRLDGRGWA